MSQDAHKNSSFSFPVVEIDEKVVRHSSKPPTSAFDGFGQYMQEKIRKLNDQFPESLLQKKSDIFKGISIFVTGHTEPSFQDLKQIMAENGGKFHHYYSKDEVTHVIASNLAVNRAREFQNVSVLRPEWIVDSIKAQRILSPSTYELKHFFSSSSSSSTSTFNLFKEDTNAISTTRSPLKPPGIKDQQMDASSPGFISKFYSSSRLHHLSTWKTELQKYSFRSKPHVKDAVKRIIMYTQSLSFLTDPRHVDMDCFFASVALRDRPDLLDSPVAVSHGTGHGGLQSSDIASCNYIARSKGVKNGMLVGRARDRCPNLQILPYEFEKYKEATGHLYEILTEYADALEAVSCDEAYIDVSSRISFSDKLGSTNVRIAHDDVNTHSTIDKPSITDYARVIAHKIRERSGLNASIGISSNMLGARIATTLAKPSGIFYLTSQNLQRELDLLPIETVPGIGWSLSQKLKDAIAKKPDSNSFSSNLVIDLLDDEVEMATMKKNEGLPSTNTLTCEQVRTTLTLKDLQNVLGTKTGLNLYNSLRGIDERVVSSDSSLKTKRQSVSVEVNWGIRFENVDQTDKFLENLWNELQARLSQVPDAKPKKVVIIIAFRHPDAPEVNPFKYLGCGHCERMTRSFKFQSEFNHNEALQEAMKMFWKCCAETMNERYKDMNQHEKRSKIIRDIRGIGFQYNDLDYPSSTPTKQPQFRNFSPEKNQNNSPFKRPNHINFKKLEEAMRKDEIEKGIARRKRRLEDIYIDDETMALPIPKIDTTQSRDEILFQIMHYIDRHDFHIVHDCLMELDKQPDMQEVLKLGQEYMKEKLKW